MQKVEPTGIYAAIAAAMGEIKPLAKEDRNAHGNYNFAGIDAFLDLTRPICARHGLTILQEEEAFEIIEVPGKQGVTKMLLMRFAFTVAMDGQSVGPLHRSIMVPATMGSQAFGSAQSYALKQFLRSLFQISTGEKDDIDAHDTGELGTYKGGAQQEQRREPVAPVITDEQLESLILLLETTNVPVAELLKAGHLKKLSDLHPDNFDEAKKWINKRAIEQRDQKLAKPANEFAGVSESDIPH